MTSCIKEYLIDIDLHESKGTRVKIMMTLANSWTKVEEVCENFKELENCLDSLHSDVINNCIYSQHERALDSVEDYIGFSLSNVYLYSEFICKSRHNEPKVAFECASKCKIDSRNCNSIEESIDKCLISTPYECKEDHYQYDIFYSLLFMRECFKQPTCERCGDEHKKIFNWFKNENPETDNKIPTNQLLIENAQSSDENIQLAAITQIHKKLSTKNEKWLKDLIDVGLIPVLVKCLRTEDALVQLEAVSCLKHIASSTKYFSSILEEEEVISTLIKLLVSTDTDIHDKIVSILATLISKKPKLRKYYMKEKIVEPLYLSIHDKISITTLRKIALITAYLCHSDENQLTADSQTLTFTITASLMELVYHHDGETIIDTVKIMYRNTKNITINHGLVIKNEILKTLVAGVNDGSSAVGSNLFALTFLIQEHDGHIEAIQAILDYGILKSMKNLLRHDDEEIIIAALYLLSNIFDGTNEQIQAVFDAGLVYPMIKLLESKNDALQSAVFDGITKLMFIKNQEQISKLLEFNIVPILTKILKDGNTKLNKLELFLSIIQLWKKTDSEVYKRGILLQFWRDGGENIGKSFFKHENKNIVLQAYQFVKAMLEAVEIEFFSDDENKKMMNKRINTQDDIGNKKRDEL